ncbi:YijD family membrane protein [Brenneria populi subsp. brevivirga]|uniref:YijD family membrane protein n=1 Tax=Brenneria populi TaxID=1505588 RepID=UPI002E16C64D|nr:YijD family membrane protein [Brenneria populi subsp. brevivirga]
MTEPSHHYREKGTLILALVAGLSINGSFSALFSALVPFSIFPLIALVLSVYCLYQRYVDRSMSESAPLLVAASFLLGLLLYSAIVRVEYPAIGSNFIPSLLCVALVLWIGLRLKSRAAANEGDAPEA